MAEEGATFDLTMDMDFVSSQTDILVGGLKEIVDGLTEYGQYQNIGVGEVDYTKIDYPSVQVVPGRTDETTDLEYSQEVELFFYYQKDIKGKEDHDILNMLKDVGRALYYVEEQLKTSDIIGPYKMTSAEPYAPFDVKNNRLIPILVTMEYKMHKGG